MRNVGLEVFCNGFYVLHLFKLVVCSQVLELQVLGTWDVFWA